MNFGPIAPNFPHFLHGGDYNPDQWIDTPEIWDEDMRLMKLSNCNAMSVGIFSWVALEPEEGRFEFGWLDKIMDKIADNGGKVILATPSGARPAWMSQKYPEVLRVTDKRVRKLHGERHNHCFSSPVYREKVRIINTKLAERYKDHPALIMWHISNEYSGDCHCEYCQEAFRNWLKERYDNDLHRLNHAWWTSFWSHTYTDWSQIESPSSLGEKMLHGLNLDWKRFTTHQTIEFMKNEIEPLKAITPSIPVTNNFMKNFQGLDYFKMAKYVDVISWDSYPDWHCPEKEDVTASKIAFNHDSFRCMRGGQPFMLMESTPSLVNWKDLNKIKRPGMHLLSSMQAVAHGSDTVQYFQWRKSRGSFEKFHGAVVDHSGHENTRVFREVTQVGEYLKKMDKIVGTSVQPDAAIIFDWENWWAVDECRTLRNTNKDYLPLCEEHYYSLWRKGVPVDIIDSDCDFSKYKLLIAPMLYMIKPGVADRIKEFVNNGGTLVTTYFTGYVNETDLCFLGGFPGPLREVVGIWAEEIDALYETDVNHVAFAKGNELNVSGEYSVKDFCEIIHAESAKVLASYKSDFYKDMPAFTVNNYGKGKAYHIAARVSQDMLNSFYDGMINDLSLLKSIDVDLPEGVSAQLRTDGENAFIFVMNFSEEPKLIKLGDQCFFDIIEDALVHDEISLEPYAVRILEKSK